MLKMMEKETNGNTVRSTPSTNKGTKAPRDTKTKSPGQTTKDLVERKANK